MMRYSQSYLIPRKNIVWSTLGSGISFIVMIMERFVEVSAMLGIDGTDEGLAASWFDYDRDGWPDLYVANDFYGPDRLYRNLEGKRFEEVTNRVLPHIPWFSMGTDVGDINNDGWPDLMTSDMAGSDHYKSKMGMGDMEDSGWFLRSSNPKQYMRNSLYLNSGNSRFFGDRPTGWSGQYGLDMVGQICRS